jgi:hypothetical protein
MPNSTTAARSYGWLWFFIILAVLTVALISSLVIFNLRQQLKPKDIEEARECWQQHGPRDYDLDYLVTKPESSPEHFHVRVRDGKTVFASLNDLPLAPAQLRYYGMIAMFDDLENFLELDAQPGRPRTFLVATFDAGDGHLVHYVRRVMGGRERVEVTVRLDPPAAN